MFNTLSEFESYIKNKTIKELTDISLHIDRNKYPDRYLVVGKYINEKKRRSQGQIVSSSPRGSIKDTWWFHIFISIFFFYKGLYLLFISDEERISGGFGGALLQFIKTEIGTVPVSFICLCAACFYLYSSIKKIKMSIRTNITSGSTRRRT